MRITLAAALIPAAGAFVPAPTARHQRTSPCMAVSGDSKQINLPNILGKAAGLFSALALGSPLIGNQPPAYAAEGIAAQQFVDAGEKVVGQVIPQDKGETQGVQKFKEQQGVRTVYPGRGESNLPSSLPGGQTPGKDLLRNKLPSGETPLRVPGRDNRGNKISSAESPSTSNLLAADVPDPQKAAAEAGQQVKETAQTIKQKAPEPQKAAAEAGQQVKQTAQTIQQKAPEPSKAAAEAGKQVKQTAQTIQQKAPEPQKAASQAGKQVKQTARSVQQKAPEPQKAAAEAGTQAKETAQTVKQEARGLYGAGKGIGEVKSGKRSSVGSGLLGQNPFGTQNEGKSRIPLNKPAEAKP